MGAFELRTWETVIFTVDYRTIRVANNRPEVTSRGKDECPNFENRPRILNKSSPAAGLYNKRR